MSTLCASTDSHLLISSVFISMWKKNIRGLWKSSLLGRLMSDNLNCRWGGNIVVAELYSLLFDNIIPCHTLSIYSSKRLKSLFKRKWFQSENLTLRHLLMFYQRNNNDGEIWVLLSRFLKDWKEVLVIVNPKIVIRRYWKRFKLYWRRKSRGKGADRKKIDPAIIKLKKSNEYGRSAQGNAANSWRTITGWNRNFRVRSSKVYGAVSKAAFNNRILSIPLQ